MLELFDNKHQIYNKDLYIDELTGALNRRYLNLIVDREIQRSRRYKHRFSIMLADLDNFKTINDTYGHMTGDRALRIFTKTIRESLRSADSIIRYGGDEFIIILPNTDTKGAEKVGSRVLDLLKSTEINGLKISASIGIATFPDHGVTWNEIFSAADKALYTSKRLGKARVSTPEASIHTLILPTRYLVGRREESAWVTARIRESAVLHIVKGEVGVGKTRLVMETLQNSGVNYAYARSMGSLQNVSYFLIRDLIKNLLNSKRDAVFSSFESLSSAQRKEISKFMPDIFKLHTDSTSSADRFTLYEALIAFLSHLGEEHITLLFDDLQWIDKESAEFIHYLVERAPSRLSFFGIYRTEEIEKSHISEVLALLGRTRKYNELLLKPLNLTETKLMLQAALGTDADDKLANVVFEESGGNPFFIEEILRTLYDNGWIYLENNRWYLKKGYKISPTQNLEQIITRKMQSLNEREKLILDYASVCGREIDVMILSRAAGFNEGEVFDILDKLVKVNILKEGTSSDYVFMEGVIREVVEKKLSRGKRKYYHNNIAKTIEEVYGSSIKDHLEELVYHYQIAGNDEKTRFYAKMAGDKAREVYAYQKAIEYYSLAIEGLPPDENTYAIMYNLIEAYKSLGNHKKAINEMQKMLTLFPQHRAEILESLADSYIRIGEWRNAIEHYTQAIELTDSEHEKNRIEVEMAWALLNLGDHDSAKRILEKAENYLNSLGDKKENYNTYVWIYTCYATMANIQQRPEEAALNYNKALKYSQKMNHQYNIAVSHLNLGIALSSLNKQEEALEHFNKALDISEKNNFLYLQAVVLQSMAQPYLNMGEFKKALDIFKESEKRFKLMKNFYNLMLNHTNMIDIYINLYELDRAMEYAEEAERLSQELHTPFDHIYIRLAKAEIYLLKRDFAKAEEILKSIKDDIYKTPDRSLPARWLETMGDVKYETQEYKEAFRLYKEALDYCKKESLMREMQAILHLKLAKIYAMTGNKAEENHIESAMEIKESYENEYIKAVINFHLAEVYWTMGKKDKAGGIFKDILPLFIKKNARVYEEKIKQYSKAP